jgi:hypothetical protein
MDAIQMFLRQHAQVHSAEPGQAEGSLADWNAKGWKISSMRRRSVEWPPPACSGNARTGSSPSGPAGRKSGS